MMQCVVYIYIFSVALDHVVTQINSPMNPAARNFHQLRRQQKGLQLLHHSGALQRSGAACYCQM